MNILAIVASAGLGELALNTVAKRCLLYKVNAVGDQIAALLWQIGTLGLIASCPSLPATAEPKDDSDTQISAIMLGSGKPLPTLLESPHLSALKRMDITGQISLVYKILLDYKDTMKHDHNQSARKQQQQQPIPSFEDSQNESYFACTTVAVETRECNSPLCTFTMEEMINQLEESTNVICRNIIALRTEHARHERAYKLERLFWRGLNDEVFWLRIEKEMPILDHRIQRFFQAISWSQLLSQMKAT